MLRYIYVKVDQSYIKNGGRSWIGKCSSIIS